MGYPRGSSLRLGELIDLELGLAEDRDQPRAQVVSRDARLGRALDATHRTDDDLVRRWLKELGGDRPSTGYHVDQALRLVTTIAAAAGLVLGIAVVGGWIGAHRRHPINVLHFWSVVVGVQLLLLAAVVLLVLIPMVWIERLPGVEPLVTLARGLCRLVPMAGAWVVMRLLPAHRLAIERVRGQLRQLAQLYGRLQVLLAVRVTQVFAIGFNLGAIATLVIAGYVTDPAFGWKSLRMQADDVHAVARAVAAPWSGVWRQALPDPEQVRKTRYTDLDARFGVPREEVRGTWDAWWAFMVASLVFYGLLPRGLLGLWASIMIALSLRRICRQHPGLSQLLNRLHRPPVSTEAKEAEKFDESMPPPPGGVEVQSHLTAPAYHVLKWGGVGMDETQVRQWLREYHRAQAASVHEVGGVDPKADAAAIAALSADPQRTAVLLLVGAWEPPTGDYMDFLGALRSALGERRMVHVLLYQRGSGGWLRSAKPVEVRLWKSHTAALGDPWLDVEPMIQGAGA